MDKTEAYNQGYSRGYDIGENNEILYFSYDDHLDRIFGPELREVKEILLNVMTQQCHEIEEIDRQFSPFEFLAHELNNTPHPDCTHNGNEYCDRCNWYQHEELWQAFDNGISKGIQDALTERLGIKEAHSMFRELSEHERKEFVQWARENFVPDRDPLPVWHPVVREEWIRLQNEHKEQSMQ